MAINLDNAQYGKFVQFAQEQMQAGNATAIARDGGEGPGGGPLVGHAITAATGDKVAPLWRTRENKDANNATRDLFRQTIVDMFGGEANIPASVRNTMKMEDYGQGKPLTARRILAVKTELDRIAAGNAAFNASIVKAISDGRMERLPQEMQDGLASVVEHFRDVYGADIVPAGETIAQIVNAAIIASGVKALADAANAQGRPIATADLVGLYDQKASERLAGEAATLAKYAKGLPQETVPILARLVRVLDWRGNAAAASEEIVKNYAEDMKAWRDIASGSPDAKGLQDVLQRRMNGYLKYILAGTRGFNTGDHSGLFQTFLEDLPRCKYAINGKTIRGKTLQEKMVPFLESIKDPAKRKAVSVMINQQMWGDYTASVANRLPFSGWKAGMQDEPIDTVPGIEKFASRDFLKTGYQLFDTGPMEFAIEVAPDESTVTVRTSSAYPMHADISVPTATTGMCTVTQEFVIDFTGAEPAIRDLRIGQALT